MTVSTNPKKTGLMTQDIVPPVRTTAVILGDSITARNFAVSSSYNSYSDNGYFNWANAYLGQRFLLLNNAGVPGDGTANILGRVSSGVLAFNPGYCFVLGGYNDIATGVTWQTTVANLQAIYQTLTGNGIKVIAISVMPSTQFTTQTMRDAVANINTWMREYCKNNEGMYFVDVYTPLLDPTSSVGGGIAGYFADGIHPTTSGAQVMGLAISNALSSIIPKTGIITSIADVCSSTSTYGNMVTNPVMQGSGGSAGSGFSGTIAANWVTLIEAGTVTVTCSTPARSDFPNMNWQQMAINDTSGLGVIDLYQQKAFPAGINVGDQVYAQAELNITALATTTVSRMLLTLTAANSSYTPVPGVINNVIAMGNNDGAIALGSYIVRTPPLTIPTGGTNFTLTAQIALAGAGTATFQVGRVELRKVYQL